MLLPIVQGGHSAAGNVVTIALTTESDVSILTKAVAAGYDNSKKGTIAVTLASGQNLTASSISNYALRTGALNAETALTISITGSVCGKDGTNRTGSASAGVNGTAGGNAGNALHLEYQPSGSGSISVTVNSGGVIGGGSGGAGQGGGAGQRRNESCDGKGNCSCTGSPITGSGGGAGSARTGCRALAGNAGGSGSYGGGSSGCHVTSPGSGGSGGSAGAAISESTSGIVYSLTNNGNVYGATA